MDLEFSQRHNCVLHKTWHISYVYERRQKFGGRKDRSANHPEYIH